MVGTMTVEQIKAEMAQIRELKRTDIQGAREKWKALKDRVTRHCDHHKLPMMWREVLEKELTVI